MKLNTQKGGETNMYRFTCGTCRKDFKATTLNDGQLYAVNGVHFAVQGDFMEGVSEDDYCPTCGQPLHEIITMPNGTKRMVAHEVNSKECKETRALYI